MRASELTEFSTTDKKIDRILKDKGYKRLGAGVDQTAYREPGTGLVLKIFGTQGGESFSRDHRMFFAWAKYCMKNSTNPFLPKFSGYESFVLDGDRYLQIRQEALKPADYMGDTLSEIADSVEHNGIRNFKQLDKQLEGYYYYQMLKEQLGADAMKMLFATIRQVYLTGERNGWNFDLHSGNIMRRGKTPVIVDPWVV